MGFNADSISINVSGAFQVFLKWTVEGANGSSPESTVFQVDRRHNGSKYYFMFRHFSEGLDILWKGSEKQIFL